MMASNPPYDDDWSGDSRSLETGSLRSAQPAEGPEQSTHTPLPWEVWAKSPTIIEQRGAGVPVASAINPGNYPGRTLDEMEATARANAQFIVTACNNYEALKNENAELKSYIGNANHALNLGISESQEFAKKYEALKQSHAALVQALESAKPYVDEKSGIGMNGPNTAAFVQAHIVAALANARKITEGL